MMFIIYGNGFLVPVRVSGTKTSKVPRNSFVKNETVWISFRYIMRCKKSPSKKNLHVMIVTFIGHIVKGKL